MQHHKKQHGLVKRILVLFFILAIIFDQFIPAKAALDTSKVILLTVAVDKSNVQVNETFTYTLNYSYSSTTTNFSNEKINVVLPAPMTYVSSVLTNDVLGEPAVLGQTVTYSMKNVNSATGVIRLTCKYPAGSIEDDTIGTIDVTGGNGDPDSTGTVTVANEPSVSVAVNDNWTWSISKDRIIPVNTIDPAVGSDITYRITLTGNALNGFPISNVTLTDTIPVGGTYVDSEGGTYSGGVVTWDIGTLAPGQTIQKNITISYPTADIGSNYINQVSANGTRTLNGAISTINAQNTVHFGAPNPGTSVITKSSRQSNDRYAKNQTAYFYLQGAGNGGNIPLTSMTIVDVIPEGYNLSTVTSTEPLGGASNLYYTLSDVEVNGTIVSVDPGSWVPWDGIEDVSEYGVITAVKWVYTSVPVGYRIPRITLTGKYLDSVIIGEVLTNHVYLDAEAADPSTIDTKTATASITVSDAYPWITVDKSASVSSAYEDEIITYSIKIANHEYATGNLDLTHGETLTVIDTMPLYNSNPVFSDFHDNSGADSNIERIVTGDENGVTQAKWILSNLIIEPGQSKTFTYTVKVKKGTRVGTYSNSLAISSDITLDDRNPNPSDSQALYVKFSGSLRSVKGIGGSINVVAEDSAYKVEDSSGAVLQKGTDYYFQTSGSNNFSMPLTKPIVNATIPGGIVRYRLEVQNQNTNGPISNVVIVDKLPKLHDTGVIVPAFRDSAWRPYLVNAVTGANGTALDGDVTIKYSTSDTPDLSKLYNPTATDSGWLDSVPANITDVTYIKIEINRTFEPSAAGVVIEWDMRAPFDAPTTNGSIAWNSFAFGAMYDDASAPGGKSAFLPSEPFKVGMRIEPHLAVTPNDGRLGNFIWEDMDYDGIQDAGEPGINDVIVRLYKDTDDDGTVEAYEMNPSAPYAFTRTGNNAADQPGYYLFPNLSYGKYIIEYEMPATYYATKVNQGDDDKDSDFADSGNGVLYRTAEIDFNPAHAENAEDITWDAGIYRKASLGNLVWKDVNHNGKQDGGSETGIGGVTVKLYDSSDLDNSIATTSTAGDGTYSFSNIDPGSYVVKFTNPADTTFCIQNAGADDAIDSDADASGQTPIVTLQSNETNNTLDAGVHKARLGDFVWEDVNYNGIQDAAEVSSNGLNGVTVKLYKASDPNNVFMTATTANYGGKAGYYHFEELDSGNYELEFVPPVVTNPWLPTKQDQIQNPNPDTKDSDMNTGTKRITGITLSPGEEDLDEDAGFYRKATIGDYVFNDLNHDGQQNDSSFIVGAEVELYKSDDTYITNTLTGADGKYQFVVDPGTYYLVFTTPANYVSTSANTGSDSSDSDAGTGGKTGNYTLVSNQSNLTADAGFHKGRLGNYVWEDMDYDGVQEGGEPGISGATVELYTDPEGTPIRPAFTTAADGYYYFNDLDANTYYVKITISGYIPTRQNQGGNDTLDSDAGADGFIRNIDLALGEQDITNDAGFYRPAKVGDYVFEDKNGNGQQDGGDQPIQGVDVELQDTSGEVLDTDTTDATGKYEFANLTPGSYRIRFILKNGYDKFTLATQGGNTSIDSDANVSTGITANFTLRSNDNNTTIDAGMYKYCEIGDFVWMDADTDGIQDVGETGISGVTVHLFKSGTEITPAKVTGSDGAYLFNQLMPGTYKVVFDILANYSASPKDAGGNDNNDSDGVRSTTIDTTATVDNIIMVSGEVDHSIDQGLYHSNTLGDKVWLDLDGDGTQDSSESGISGVTVQLYDSSNALIATQTTDANGLYLFSDISNGDYYIKVTPPSGYSVTTLNSNADDTMDSDADRTTFKTGLYTLSGNTYNITVDIGLYRKASLGDIVWLDTNANGIQDIGEPPLQNITVKLFRNAIEEAIDTHVTGADGIYTFNNLDPGIYSVEFTIPNGYTISTANAGGDGTKDSDATIKAGSPTIAEIVNYQTYHNDVITTLDLGLYQPASAGDYVWEDVNHNGVQDGGEPAIEGVSVTLQNTSGTILANTTTGADGKYLFSNLVPGSYRILFALKGGFDKLTLVSQGSDGAIDSDADETTRLTSNFTLQSGDNKTTFDAGMYRYGQIGDLVWKDTNMNGIQDDGEPGIQGVTVRLYKSSNELAATKVTGANGYYIFSQLLPDTYKLVFELPDNYSVTTMDAGGNDSTDSDGLRDGIIDTTATVEGITIVSGNIKYTYDLGLYQSNSLGDKVWLDADGDGTQDNNPAESGVFNVPLALYDSGDHLIAQTASDEDGFYLFSDLPNGQYYVKVSLPGGYYATIPNNNADDAVDSDVSGTPLKTDTYALIGNTHDHSADVGLFRQAGLGDMVWLDTNGNGIQDIGELPVEGVSVKLIRGSIELTDTTDENGTYFFPDLDPGVYSIEFTVPDGYKITENDKGNDDAKDSDAQMKQGAATTAVIANYQLNDNETVNTLDLGIWQPASLGDYVWYDSNINGIQDPGESPAVGIKVVLIKNGTEIMSTNTDNQGLYLFNNLAPGDYGVSFTRPFGYSFTVADKGLDDTKDSDANYYGMVSTTLVTNENRRDVDAGLYYSYVEPATPTPTPTPTPSPSPSPTPTPGVVPPKPSPSPTPVASPSPTSIPEPTPTPKPVVVEEKPKNPEEVVTEKVYIITEPVEEVKVLIPPEHGTVEITGENKIIFHPGPTFTGKDKIVVELIIDGEPQEIILDIFDENLALSAITTDLPKTGGIPLPMVLALGTILIVAGIVTRRLPQK